MCLSFDAENNLAWTNYYYETHSVTIEFFHMHDSLGVTGNYPGMVWILQWNKTKKEGFDVEELI